MFRCFFSNFLQKLEFVGFFNSNNCAVSFFELFDTVDWVNWIAGHTACRNLLHSLQNFSFKGPGQPEVTPERKMSSTRTVKLRVIII